MRDRYGIRASEDYHHPSSVTEADEMGEHLRGLGYIE
jgi:hypothetical protein